MKDEVNAKLNFMRNFSIAPSVLEERAQDLFVMEHPSPFMTIAYPVRPEWQERLGAITHVDEPARVQTVSADTNPKFHSLISALPKKQAFLQS